MKAKQLLKMYANGRKDFRGENLRGLSFKNQDLSEADFSDCDIRGTNFSGANLREAKFINTQAGLPRRWAIILLLACLVLAFVAGFLIILVGTMITLIYDKDLTNQIAGWFGLFIIIDFSWLSFYQGVRVGARAIAVTVALVIAFSVAETLVIAFALAEGFVEAVSGGTFAKVFAVVIAFAVAFTIAFAVAFVGTFIGSVAFAVAFALDGFFLGAFVGVLAIILAIILATTLATAFAFTGSVARNLAFAGTITIGITILNFYLGWRAIKGDPREEWIREMALNFASTGSTTFDQANLTDADFTGAILKNANFEKAELINTCFEDTKKLDLACW